MKISPDDLAYWYLRLNGFLTTVNFVVHPDTGGSQRTDVDILGVRFPHRSELLIKPMDDDPTLILDRSRTVFVIAEVKASLCSLNGPWTNEKDKNMHRVIRSIGLVPISSVNDIAASLYKDGKWENNQFLLSLMCFGRDENSELYDRYPKVPQINWTKVTQFIFDRFHRYSRQKASHPQWDVNGRNLWDTVHCSDNAEEMLSRIDFAQ